MRPRTAIREATGPLYRGWNGFYTSITAQLPEGPEKRNAESYKNEFSDFTLHCAPFYRPHVYE
jgi:hypothetical protein